MATRKLDRNGNPIVTKEELEKTGMTLRDFLNKERGLTRKVGSASKRGDGIATKGKTRGTMVKMNYGGKC